MERQRLFFASCLVVLTTGCLDPTAQGAASPTGASDPGAADGTGTLTTADGTPYVWNNVEILGGGFVTGVIFSDEEKGLAYARTDIGGAYRLDSKDGSWIPITDHLGRDDAMGIESLALDPTDPNKVYIALGTYTQEWAGAGAMLRSKNRGKDWERTDMPIKMGGNEYGRSCGERLAVDPNSPNLLLFGSRRNGLWRSEDGSVSWKQAGFPVKSDPAGIGIVFVRFDAKSGTPGKPTPVVYAGVGVTEGPQNFAVRKDAVSLYVTKDAGNSWQPVPGQPKGLLPSHAELDNAGMLYLSYRNHPGPNDVTTGAVWKFDPKAQAWTDVTPLKPTQEDKFGYGAVSVDGKRAGTLLVTTLDRWTNKDEIFRSTDGGQSWKKVGSTAKWDVNGAQYVYWGRNELHVPHWMGDADLDPFNPDRATFVTGAGIWTTENLTQADSDQPTTWKFTNQGLEETSIMALASPPTGPPLLSGMGDICGFRHDDLGVAPPDGFFMKPQCNGTTRIEFAEGDPNFVVRVGRVWGEEPHGAYSTDGGKTWTAFGTEPKNAKTGGVVTVTADAKSIVWAPKGQVPQYSTDRGNKWSEVKGAPGGTELPDWSNFDLQPAADRVNPKLVYLYDAHRGHVYVSRDAGASVERTRSGLPELADWQLLVASIEVTPGFEGHVWLTTGKDVYRSTDSGQSFQGLGTVQESYGIGLGKAAPGSDYPALYLVGMVDGIKGFFRSDDIGETWVRINDDRHQFGMIGVVEGDPRIYGRVYLGTSGRGIVYGMPNNLAAPTTAP